MAERLQEKINALHEQLSKLRARLEVDALVRQNAARLRKRLLEMKAELVNEEPLKLLVEGYSDKAMKRLAVQAISTRLMKEVNKYSRHVFSEDYTFSFNWDKSDLALLVHRKYGKKVITSDVRKLSGAESKLFTIVLVLALLTFVPSRKRCNLMIMDEPTANMSEENTKAFMDLLPVLNKIIPSIIVITPRSKDIYPGATSWTMVKTNGSAKLLPGHPDDHKKKV
jgi:DNA repair exonuclease SbcCD ATPase subunit